MKNKSIQKSPVRGLELKVEVDTREAIEKIAELKALLEDVSAQIATIVNSVSTVNIKFNVSKDVTPAQIINETKETNGQ